MEMKQMNGTERIVQDELHVYMGISYMIKKKLQYIVKGSTTQ